MRVRSPGGLLGLHGKNSTSRCSLPGLRRTDAGHGPGRRHPPRKPGWHRRVYRHPDQELGKELAPGLKPDTSLPVGRACTAMVRVSAGNRRGNPSSFRGHGHHEHSEAHLEVERPVYLVQPGVCAAVPGAVEGSNGQRGLLGSEGRIGRPAARAASRSRETNGKASLTLHEPAFTRRYKDRPVSANAWEQFPEKRKKS